MAYRRSLVLSAMSMVPIGFRALVEAAASAGFDAVSVVTPVYRRAVRDEGLSVADMRRILDDHGIRVSEIEAAGNWLTPPEDKPRRWAQRMADREYIDLGASLGATTLVAVHFGSPRPVDEAAAAFAGLCDEAATAGLQVALEYPAFATICDVNGAWEVVRRANRTNAGLLLDTWHHYRGPGDDDTLAGVPGPRILALQLADADLEIRGSLEEDVLLRRLPGHGCFPLAALLRTLDRMGVTAPIGIEVWDEALLAQGPARAAARLKTSIDETLTAAA